MGPVSYLSRLIGDGGKREILTPPRVLFRPVLPTNPGLTEIESEIGSSEPRMITPLANGMVSMKSGPPTPINIPDLSASRSQPAMSRPTPQPLTVQTPAQVPQLSDGASNFMQVGRSLQRAPNAQSASMLSPRSVGRQLIQINPSNPEPAPVAAGIVDEVSRQSTRPARAADSIIDKTMNTGQTGMAHSRSVVSRRESRRQATTAIEDGDHVAASIQKDIRHKQPSNMSLRSEAAHSHRIFLTPPAPAIPEKSTHRSDKREQRGSDSSPAIHIGTLEVRISPPEVPRVIPKTASGPRPTVPLARGFRSFGLAQG